MGSTPTEVTAGDAGGPELCLANTATGFDSPRLHSNGHAPVVKRTSFRASKAAFRVRILAGVLDEIDPVAQRQQRLPDTEEIGGSIPPRIIDPCGMWCTGSHAAL